MRFLIVPMLLVGVVGCGRGEIYPTAHEAYAACYEWKKEKEERSCQGDKAYFTTVDPTPTIIGFEDSEVVRRFKWRIQ